MTEPKRIDVLQPAPDMSAELGPAPHYRDKDNTDRAPSCPCEACYQIRLASWEKS